MSFSHPKRQELISFLKQLRDEIILSFEILEDGKKFQYEPWKYHQEGGGEIALLRGKVFEKAAVNWSGVGGDKYPIANKGAFFATGISIITHMANPHAPTTHFNIRFIETENEWWFGGGYDLTPMGFPYQEDTTHFHKIAKEALSIFEKDYYSIFSKNAKEYFYLPHRKKERGVGGLFFDYFNQDGFEDSRKVWEAVGNSFLPAIVPIYQKRICQTFLPDEREKQIQSRAHYAEFNLLYDRGTRFGLESGGNPEAIFCSMPPLVKW